MFMSVEYFANSAPNGLCYSRWGGGTAKPSIEEKAEARKMPKNAQSPTRRVHAVLGSRMILPLANVLIDGDVFSALNFKSRFIPISPSILELQAGQASHQI